MSIRLNEILNRIAGVASFVLFTFGAASVGYVGHLGSSAAFANLGVGFIVFPEVISHFSAAGIRGARPQVLPVKFVQGVGWVFMMLTFVLLLIQGIF